jgi:hypothetical protein
LVVTITVSELRREQVPAAVDLLRQLGGQADAGGLDVIQSLVAQEEGAIVGAILCRRDGAGRCTLQVGRNEQVTDDGLMRLLVDKALLKLQARGVHKCVIAPVGPACERAFWSSLAWLAPGPLDEAA